MNIGDLFRAMISHGALTLAERIRRSSSTPPQLLTPELIAISVPLLPSTLDPRFFSPWIRNVVIPGLKTLNHPLLLTIRSWACDTANDYDEKEEGGLSWAIVLLEAVCQATAKLSADSYASFASSSPFVEEIPTTTTCHNNNTRGDGWHLMKDITNHHSITSTPSSNTTKSKTKKAPPEDNNIIDDQSSIISKRPPHPSILHLGLNPSPRKKKVKSFHNNDRFQLTTSFDSYSALSLSLPSPTSSPSSAPPTPTTTPRSTPYSDCETKLHHSHLLHHARSFGIPHNLSTLRTYTTHGASSFLSRSLVKIHSSSASSHSERQSRLDETLGRFVVILGEDDDGYDEAILAHVMELCNALQDLKLEECASLARCARNVVSMGKITLMTLRAALRCDDSDDSVREILRELSRDVLSLSPPTSNSTTVTTLWEELQEATRLLAIDGIIRRYVGSKSRDFFNLSHPRHASILVRQICRYVDETEMVLEDLKTLSEAFTSVDWAESVVMFLEHVVLGGGDGGRGEQVGRVVRGLLMEDEVWGERCAVEVLAFCGRVLEEEGGDNEEKTAAVSAACAILSVLQEVLERNNSRGLMRSIRSTTSSSIGTLSRLGARSYTLLLGEFQRLSALQSEFGLYLSLPILRGTSRSYQQNDNDDPRLRTAAGLLHPAIIRLQNNTNNTNNPTDDSRLRDIIAKTRRATYLLFGDDDVLSWCHVVERAISSQLNRKNDGGDNGDIDRICHDLLTITGLLDNTTLPQSSSSTVEASTLITVAHCHLSHAWNSTRDHDHSNTSSSFDNERQNIPTPMRHVIRATSLLKDNAIISCSEKDLGYATELAFECDVAAEVLSRADGGVGDAVDALARGLKEMEDGRRRRRERGFGYEEMKEDGMRAGEGRGGESAVLLHPSWYVGDGLLLPPSEALLYGMLSCSHHLTTKPNNHHDEMMIINTTWDLISFLGRRGAHVIALRTLLSDTVSRLTRNVGDDEYDEDREQWRSCYHGTLTCLAERSLGGTVNGITSGTIDSELAVGYMLCLPLKLAFKVYKSALPSAISRRDFGRVIVLAEIGASAGKGGNIKDAGSTTEGWKKQQTFVSQCEHLASNARWWKILQHYGVTFDPRHFGEQLGSSGSNSTKSSDYASSLVPLLIHASSKKLTDLDAILDLGREFADAFGVNQNLAPQKFIEFLLSYPSDTQNSQDSSSTTNKATPKSTENVTTIDIRYDLNRCETAIKSALLLLPSPMARSAVLRRCVMSLETNPHASKAYERHMLVLSLYHHQLARVANEKKDGKKSEYAVFLDELKRIERRQDALELLSSFFAGRSNKVQSTPSSFNERVDYPSMFLPLPNPFGSDRGKNKKTRKLCGVIRTANKKSASEIFDPLYALKDVLTEDDAASALSPLCHALGLPSGYIHARALFERFQKVKSSSSTSISLPSVSSTVLPVLSRMTSPSDAALLAEWCSRQYDHNASHERLACLERASSLSMMASTQAEELAQQRHDNGEDENGKWAMKAKKALQAVKRIDAARRGLGDRMTIVEILRRRATISSAAADVTMGNVSSMMEAVPTKVMVVLEDVVKNIDEMNEKSDPETFVENLLKESSMVAAVASLDESSGFTIDHFRLVASRVHEACLSLARKYSHVHVGDCARALARRWMLHGDDIIPSNTPSHQHNTSARDTAIASKDATIDAGPISSHVRNLSNSFSKLATSSNDDDDTVDFVMDLNAIAGGGKNVWTDDIGSSSAAAAVATIEQRDAVTLVEEPSAFKLRGSARESFEYSNARVALRIAFVVSFARDYFPHIIMESQEDDGGDNYNVEKENIVPLRQHLSSFGSKSEIFLTNDESGSSSQKRDREEKEETLRLRNKDIVMEYARELLEIVFAKSGTTSVVVSTSSNDDERRWGGRGGADDDSSVVENERLFAHRSSSDATAKNGKALTFAMRYRALRAASILCPQEALEIIAKDNGFLKDSTLKKCCYGSFVSMEIEALGLPLPHSCLVQLSNMHFSSYSRALWRHHGHNNECKGYKGRLLRLLLELCTKDDDNHRKISDTPLVLSILNEMMKLETIPRTLLFACELMVNLEKTILEAFLAFGNGEGARVFTDTIVKTSHMVLEELRQVLLDKSEHRHKQHHERNWKEFSSIVRRLGNVVANIGERITGHEQFICFAESLCELSGYCHGGNGDDTEQRKELSRCLLQIILELSMRCDDENRSTRSLLLSIVVKDENGLMALRDRFGAIEDVKGSGLGEVDKKGVYDTALLMTQVEMSMRLDVVSAIKKADKWETFRGLL